MSGQSFAIVAAVLCAAASLGQQSFAADRHAAQAEPRALDEQWSATAAHNDLDGTVAFYADDAVLLPPNAPIASDSRSRRDSWAGLLGPKTAVSWKWTKIEVAQSGELAWIYGTYTLKIGASGDSGPLNDIGKFLEVWKKQPNGRWKCIADTYNSDLPVPAPTK